MRLLPCFLFAAVAFAGQSIQFGPQIIYNETVPATPVNRVEFCIHNWAPDSYTHLLTGPGGAFGNGATGWYAYMLVEGSSGLGIAARNAWDSGVGVFIPLGGVSVAEVYVRLQHDPANLLDDYEAWDIDGNRFFSASVPYSTEVDSGIGLEIGFGNEPTVDVAFMRAHTTLVPLNSRPPVTFSPDNRLFEWKFDGDVNDATGHGYDAIYGRGLPTFVPTLNQQIVAILRANPNSWANIVSLRAGYPATLDATSSYAESDTSSAVTYFWQELSGPSRLFFSNRTSGTPTISGIVYGDYRIQLTVFDVSNNQTVTVQDVGAVAMDSKGVVVNADPNADAMLGNMIAFGKNPWGYADYWEQHAMSLRLAYYTANGWGNSGPQWEQTGAGTVSYYWNGVGASPGNTSCSSSLTAGISAITLSIPISNASCFDFTTFPTRILLLAGGPTEELRICSVSATSGPAILTACYDGRGQNAAAWNPGSHVLQDKVSGSGTKFITDAISAVCPGGAPGPTGLASYTTGVVTLTAGSATMTGSGTAWSSNMVGSYVRVPATHGGAAFVFLAQVAAVDSGTAITLNRAYPADADTGSYSHAILPGYRTIVLRGPHIFDTSAPGEWMWNVTGCESETTLYMNLYSFGNEFNAGHDVPPNDGRLMTGYQYSVTDSNSWINEGPQGGINFYGESLASRALCLRSGLTSACNAANVIDSYLVKSPWGNVDGGGYPPLFLGGLGIGAFASAVLGQGASWGDLRSYAGLGEETASSLYNGGSPLCYGGDTRDNAYTFAFLIYAAIYDPDTSPGGFRSRWVNDLSIMQAIDAACHLSDYSWASGFLWNNTGSLSIGPITVTNNSTAVTGSGLSPSACTGRAMGRGTVVNGSATLTVTSGSIPGSNIDALVITGTSGGNPLTVRLMLSGFGSSVSLSALWPGDSGSVTWMAVYTSDGNNNMISIANSAADTSDQKNNYACIWNNSNSLTLDHPWKGSSGNNYYGWIGNLSGFGQQPFFQGINVYRMGLLAAATAPELAPFAATYLDYNNKAIAWVKNTGFDMATLTTNYGRGFQFCEPFMISSTVQSDWKSPGCTYTAANPDSMSVGREQDMEIANAFSDYYIYNPDSTNKTWGDEAYGAVWGNASYNTGGVYYDAASDATNLAPTNLSDGSINIGKWYGFFAGMGMLHRWPAVRLGGVDPPNYTTVDIPFSLTGVTRAAQAQVTITAPSGKVVTTLCPVSPCAISVDKRSGSIMMKLDYLSSSGAIVSPGDTVPLYVPK
jgi:hypothetical protein